MRNFDKVIECLLEQWLDESEVSTIDELTEERKRVLKRLKENGIDSISEIPEESINVLVTNLIKQECLDEKLKDIKILTQWQNNKLGDNRTRPGESIVLIIRGDLLKRYPDTLIYAIDAVHCDGADGEPVPGLKEYLKDSEGNPILDVNKIQTILSGIQKIFPVFRATLPPDITFFGFPFSEDEARGKENELGKYFIIEEQVTEPRFGLDLPNDTELKTWDDLSWSHFFLIENESIGKYLDNAPNPNPTPSVTDENHHWTDDASSAARAWITLQKPVRIAVHASQMIPETPVVRD